MRLSRRPNACIIRGQKPEDERQGTEPSLRHATRRLVCPPSSVLLGASDGLLDLHSGGLYHLRPARSLVAQERSEGLGGIGQDFGTLRGETLTHVRGFQGSSDVGIEPSNHGGRRARRR